MYFFATPHKIQPGTGLGYTFSVPYFYDGLKYAGPKGNCADALDWVSAECSDLKVCVDMFTTWYPRTQELFPKDVIIGVDDSTNEYESLNDGTCNAIAGEGVNVLLSTAMGNGYTGGDALVDVLEMAGGMTPEEVNKAGPVWEIGTTTYSKEPLAMVTREDDPTFSDFVNWVLQALMSAEEQEITKASFEGMEFHGHEEDDHDEDEHHEDKMPMKLYSGFGEEHENMFNAAVATVGNYGEIYDRWLQPILPRGGMNMLNKDNAAQQYPHPM